MQPELIEAVAGLMYLRETGKTWDSASDVGRFLYRVRAAEYLTGLGKTAEEDPQRRAEMCHAQAAKAISTLDREKWLQMAVQWDRLAGSSGDKKE